MKIGRFTNGMEVALTPLEAAPFNGKALDVVVDAKSQREFLTIRADPEGAYRLTDRMDFTHPKSIALRRAIYKQFKQFKTEEIQSWSPGDGVLHGERPTMRGVPTIRASRADKGQAKSPTPLAPKQGGFDHIKQAVTLINNFKRTYGDQVTLLLEDDQLIIRYVVQF